MLPYVLIIRSLLKFLLKGGFQRKKEYISVVFLLMFLEIIIYNYTMYL